LLVAALYIMPAQVWQIASAMTENYR